MTNAKGGTNANKDVIYIDVDDEITAIIDKVQASDQKIIALVLPKRATVLQSIVNMKLLKRAAGDAKKNLVLITSESSLMPLAGSVGIHVAKSLNSRPEVPDAPVDDMSSSDGADEAEEVVDMAVDPSKTVGELSAQSTPKSGSKDKSDSRSTTRARNSDDNEDTIELDDEEDDDEGKSAGVAGAAAGAKPPKDKKLKIPDFNRFRLVLVLAGVGVLLLGVLAYAMLAVWPKATVVIKTDSQAVNANRTVTMKVDSATKLDTEKAVLSAQLQEVKKTMTEQVSATGQVNKGEKASGSVKLALTDCSRDSVTVPAGTGVSAGGKVFITAKTVKMDSVKVAGRCDNNRYPTDSTATVNVVAQTAGADHNIGPSNFTVSGYSGVSGSSSEAMKGGTDNIIKIVTQGDIDTAKEKITEQDMNPIKQELSSALIGRGFFPIDATFNNAEPETKLSVPANTEAESVTVTQTITYTMMAVNKEDLEKVIAEDVGKKIDIKKQNIQSYGLDKAYFSLQGVSQGEATVSVQTTAVAGAALDAETIKQQVAGKKAGDAKQIISDNPGVTEVDVTYGPFWVRAIPKKTGKITIVIEEPKVTTDDAEPSS